MSAAPEESPSPAQRLRAALVAAVLLSIFGALGWRLWKLEVVEAAHWRAVAELQQRPLREVAAYRGPIKTADGTPLAVSIRVPSAFAEPRHMGRIVKGRQQPATPEDLIDAARKIAAALGYDREREEALLERLARNPHHCWIERRIDEARADRLAKASVPGVGFKNEYRRVYPCGALAAHAIGFVTLDEDGELTGKTGMEAVLERTLKGKNGVRRIVRDGGGRGLLEASAPEVPAEDGKTVTLTIDANIQRICQAAAAKGAAEWHPEGIAIVVLRPADGRILALVSWPGYDAEQAPALSLAEAAELRRAHAAGEAPPAALVAKIAALGAIQRNRAISDTFEPGSILKPLIAAMALEKHAITPTQVFDCTSPAFFGTRAVKDVHNHGLLPFPEVISNSSNVGMSRIALALGAADTVELFRRCGFARKTGLGLPLEEKGAVPSLRGWKPNWEGVSVAQGYQIAVTPAQIACAFAALGNHGVRMQPQIVERVEDSSGRVVQAFQPKEAGQIVDADVADRIMLPALEGVVERGTAKSARLEKWLIGGKTGTAMKSNGRGYTTSVRASFVALAPIEKPEVLVLVMTDDPKPKGGRPYGGTVSAPIAKEILEQILPYLKVPPSPPRARPLERDAGPTHD